MTMKRRPLVIAAATVGALATAAFALPNLPPNPVTDTLNDRVFKEKSKRFATVADAPTRGGGRSRCPAGYRRTPPTYAYRRAPAVRPG